MNKLILTVFLPAPLVAGLWGSGGKKDTTCLGLFYRFSRHKQRNTLRVGNAGLAHIRWAPLERR
jgi:hypothetical protein